MASSIRDAITASVAEVKDDDDGLEPEAVSDDLPELTDADTAEGDLDSLTPEEPVVVEPVVVAKDDKTVEETPEAKATREAKEKPVDDPFAKEHGIKALDKKGRVNRIPYPDVVRINTNAIAKTIKPFVDLGWGIKADAKPTEVVAAVVGRVQEYETRLRSIHRTEAIMLGDSERGLPADEVRFLQMLAGAQGTKYAKLLEPAFAALRGEAPKAKEVAAVPADDPEPKPDVDLGNGQVGYSAEQHAKLRAWDRRESARIARAEIGEEFKPIRSAFENHQAETARAQTATQRLDAAFKRPGFKENVDAIYAEFMNNGLDLDAAYDKVLYGKATAAPTFDEAALKVKWLAELRAAPAATNTAAASASAASRTDEQAEEDKRNPVRAAIVGSIRKR